MIMVEKSSYIIVNLPSAKMNKTRFWCANIVCVIQKYTVGILIYIY